MLRCVTVFVVLHILLPWLSQLDTQFTRTDSVIICSTSTCSVTVQRSLSYHSPGTQCLSSLAHRLVHCTACRYGLLWCQDAECRNLTIYGIIIPIHIASFLLASASFTLLDSSMTVISFLGFLMAVAFLLEFLICHFPRGVVSHDVSLPVSEIIVTVSLSPSASHRRWATGNFSLLSLGPVVLRPLVASLVLLFRLPSGGPSSSLLCTTQSPLVVVGLQCPGLCSLPPYLGLGFLAALFPPVLLHEVAIWIQRLH